jgi:hypothetical protein
MSYAAPSELRFTLTELSIWKFYLNTGIPECPASCHSGTRMNNNTVIENNPVSEQGDPIWHCFGIGLRLWMPECRCLVMQTPCPANILYNPFPLSSAIPFITCDLIAVFRRLSRLRRLNSEPKRWPQSRKAEKGIWIWLGNLQLNTLFYSCWQISPSWSLAVFGERFNWCPDKLTIRNWNPNPPTLFFCLPKIKPRSKMMYIWLKIS